jgi:PPP family 3-phenylpropionic acid transporter
VSRARLALAVYYFAAFASLGVFFPYFPTWLEARGMTGLSMSSIVALRPVMGVIGPIGFGLLADAFGLRGSLLRLACLGSCMAFGVLAVAGLLNKSLGFQALFVVMLLFSFFRAPMTMLADASALERGGSYGRLRLWGSLGFMVLALVTGWTIDPTELAPLPVAVTLLLAAAWLAARAVPTPTARPARPVFRDARRLAVSADYRLFWLATVLWMASHAGYDLAFSLHLRDLGAPTSFIGVCWATGTLAEVWLMAVSAGLLARFGPTRLLTYGMLGVGLRWLLIGSLDSPPLLLALQPLHAVSFALIWVSALGFTKERAPAHILATAQGLFTAALAIGAGAGTLVWGPVYAQFGGKAVFHAAAAVAAVGCGVTLLLSRVQRLQHPESLRAGGQ